MSKAIRFYESPFEENMVFNDYQDVANYLNIDYKHSCTNENLSKKVLNHFSDWSVDENNKISINSIKKDVNSLFTGKFKFDIGDVIASKSGGKILILDRYEAPDEERHRENNQIPYYKCKCLTDGYEYDMAETRIMSGYGCPICSKNNVIPGVYSLGDLAPEVIPYLLNPEDAYKFTPYSTKKVWCKCPNCGTKKKTIVSYLFQHGFHCTVCSDNISYPNKFVREFLNQLNIDYIPEKTFDWSNKKQYDEYLPEYNMIIENHGQQHYVEIKGSVFGTLAEQQENDSYKRELAKTNGIAQYIELDCRESSADWIKNSIMNSELPTILNFTEDDVDWEQCDLMSQYNSEILRVCEAYKTNKNISELAEMFKHQNHIIARYLEIGAKCGFCDYEKNNSAKNGNINRGQVGAKPVYCITDDIYFMSYRVCENYYKEHGIEPFDGERVGKYVTNNKPYKGKMFVRITKVEYNEKYDESLTNKSITVVGDRFLDRYLKEV